ncbi:MAG: DUF4349 domain-containing protein [Vicingaceae bacterium]|nr:DUF4349 domain-containing protein [Vicingaceae bacterium]
MKKNLLIASIMAIMLFSCAGKSRYEDAAAPIVAGNAKAEAYDEITEGLEEEEYSSNSEDIKQDNPKTVFTYNRKLIKEGSITFETSDVKATKNIIDKATKQFNGYLSEDNEYDYGYRIQHNVTIRIPSENFDNLLASISKSVEEMDDQNISVRDVTEEYVDVEARLKSKKKVEERYLGLLSKAYSVGDILQVEHELARIREDIERVEGRLRYLKNQVSLSILRITYYETVEVENSFGFGKKVGDGFENGFKGLLWFFIGLVNIWPFLFFIAIGVWFLVRWIKRRSKK